MHYHSLSLTVALVLTASAAAQELYVCEQSTDQVMIFSEIDGSLINQSFIDLNTSSGSAPVIPYQAIEAVPGEIWITDLGADIIFRWSADGTQYLGEFGMGQDNIRGIHIEFGSCWVANFGAGGNGYGNALVEYDLTTTFVQSNAAPGSPWGIITFGSELMTTDATNDDLVIFDPVTSTFSGVFHDSDGVTGIDFPYQLQHAQSGASIFCAGFQSPSGLYEYDLTGNQINFYDAESLGFGGCRGVYELQNGNLLFTTGLGVHVFDTTANTVTTVLGGISGRTISKRGTGALGTNYCMAALNSTGAAADISSIGSSAVSINNVELMCEEMPLNAFAYFLTSQTQAFVVGPGGSMGNLCVGGSVGRYVGPGQIQNSGSAGSVNLAIDLSNHPTPTGLVQVAPGETWNFTCWFRDSVGGTATSNFSDGLEVTFN